MPATEHKRILEELKELRDQADNVRDTLRDVNDLVTTLFMPMMYEASAVPSSFVTIGVEQGGKHPRADRLWRIMHSIVIAYNMAGDLAASIGDRVELYDDGMEEPEDEGDDL